MRRRGGPIAGILFACFASSAFAQSGTAPATPFELGRAALEQDPARAITYFEQVDTSQGREWLAVALMMESRSASDRYVERAFETAMRSRVDQAAPARPRADLAASLLPGDMVIAYLVSETHAYAWAFDRGALVGFPLPPPAALVAAVTSTRAYIDQKDSDGVGRIAEQLLPALLGPAEEQLPQLRRLIFVLDGPLRQLPMRELGSSRIPRGIAIETTDYASLSATIARPPTPADSRMSAALIAVIIGSVVAILLALGAGLRKRR